MKFHLSLMLTPPRILKIFIALVHCSEAQATSDALTLQLWPQLSGFDWANPSTLCTMPFVCDASGMYVTEVHLSNYNLQGTIPDLSGLTYLQILDLSNNSLSGQFPQPARDFASLVVLQLSHNMLTGPLPSSLMSSQSLKYLILDHNMFDMPTLVEASSLVWFDMSYNNVTSELPSEIPMSLFLLDLSHNQITGDLPAEWTDKSGLRHLALRNNQLLSHGRVTIELPFVNFLDLSENSISSLSSFTLASPAFLDVSSTSEDFMLCPEFGSASTQGGVAFVHTPCALRWTSFWGIQTPR
jgi:Leucine-rich repeat (LRR) protein